MIYDYLYPETDVLLGMVTGEKIQLYFIGIGEQNGNFEGWGSEQMQIWGTPKHKKTNFQFFGNKLIFIWRVGGGTREQVPPSHGRASYRKLLEKHK